MDRTKVIYLIQDPCPVKHELAINKCNIYKQRIKIMATIPGIPGFTV